MKKALFYRWFGIGKIPFQIRSALQIEGIVVTDEGLKSSLTYINFRAPGKRSSWRRVWFNGSVTITNTRLVALRGAQPMIDVPFSDERFGGLQISAEDAETLLVRFDASLFHTDWSGTLEYRFHTELVKEFADKSESR